MGEINKKYIEKLKKIVGKVKSSKVDAFIGILRKEMADGLSLDQANDKLKGVITWLKK